MKDTDTVYLVPTHLLHSHTSQTNKLALTVLDLDLTKNEAEACLNSLFSKINRLNEDKKQKPSFFSDTNELLLAAALLKDGALPLIAHKFFAQSLIDGVIELQQKKISLTSFNLKPRKRGRKKNLEEHLQMIRSVDRCLNKGLSKKASYNSVGEKHFKSPETIRRIYERFKKYKESYDFYQEIHIAANDSVF